MQEKRKGLSDPEEGGYCDTGFFTCPGERLLRNVLNPESEGLTFGIYFSAISGLFLRNPVG